MAQRLPLHIVLFSTIIFFIISCNKDTYKATQPVYISVPGIQLSTDPTTEGSNHHKINTVWILVNDKQIGTYELPCTVPAILDEGENKVQLFPGIFLNGSSSMRAIYEPYNSLDFTLQYSGNTAIPDTLVPDSADLVTTYSNLKTVTVLEDFDQSGINLETTPQSDTGITKTNDPSKIFVNPETGMSDGEVGEIVLTGNQNLAELVTVESYDISVNRANAFVEVSYRSNVPITVGVIADLQSQIVQAPTVVILPKDEWNKIYINLVSEITAYANAVDFKIFFGVIKSSDIDTARVYLDNLKLVY